MRYVPLLSRFFALGFGMIVLAGEAPVRAQSASDLCDKVEFETADQVRIQGTFYPSTQGRKAPCVLLLHPPGEGNHHGAWDELAAELQEDGLAVLAFDFRGHGDSRQVSEAFWQVAENRQRIRGFNPRSPAETIDANQFHAAYYPMLVNDIVAARTFLERKNDSRECNSAEVFVVGAGEGATLGAAWLAAESARYRVIKSLTPRLAARPQVADVLGAVWLNPSPTLAGRAVPLLDWLKTAGRDQAVPMAFLHGAEDPAARRWSERFLTAAQPREGSSKWTASRGIDRTKDEGLDLLKSRYDTRSLIRNYVGNVTAEHAGAAWEAREFNDQAFTWSWPGKGSVIAKIPDETSLRLVPLAALGIR